MENFIQKINDALCHFEAATENSTDPDYDAGAELYREISEIMESVEKDGLIAVVEDYSFDPDTKVVLFQKDEDAGNYLEARYNSFLEEERREESGSDPEYHTLREDHCICSKEQGFGRISWEVPDSLKDYDDELEVWTIKAVNVTKPVDFSQTDRKACIKKEARSANKLADHEAIIRVPLGVAKFINKHLHHEPEDENECFGEDEASVSYSVNFDNGYEVSVMMCGVQFRPGESNTAWTQAVLYDKEGRQVSYTEPADEFFGEWWMEDDDGAEYYVNVVPAPDEIISYCKSKELKAKAMYEACDDATVGAINGLFKIELTYIGEGYSGDYNENDPDDEPLLRADIFYHDMENEEDGQNEDYYTNEPVSTCTDLSADISLDAAEELVKNLLKKFTARMETKRCSEQHILNALHESMKAE